MRNRPLRVAMLGPISWRTPPRHYGPWEFIVSNLTEQLVMLGVDVTLFASLDSRSRARLRGVAAGGYSENHSLDRWVWTGLHISELFECAKEFDIIHNHFDFLPLTYSRLVSTPLLTTIHGISSDSILPVYRKYCELPYVSISLASRHAKLNYVRNIYHGIDPQDYSFSDRPDNYLLFLGRICAEKGVHEAIELARRVGRPLRIAGIIQDPVYFREKVEPSLDGERIRFLGPVGGKCKQDLLSGAFASVLLCDCEEAFGLSIIESLACGTPVIATRRGAIPEILDDRCGLVVGSLDEAESHFNSIARIVRRTCRQVVEERFTSTRMAKEYLEVYCELVDSARTETSTHD